MKLRILNIVLSLVAALLIGNVYATSAPKNKPVTVVAAQSASGKVNVNTASVDELKTLKGIGAKRAEAIVNYRHQHGKITSLDELAKVKGIGNKHAQLLKEQVEF